MVIARKKGDAERKESDNLMENRILIPASKVLEHAKTHSEEKKKAELVYANQMIQKMIEDGSTGATSNVKFSPDVKQMLHDAGYQVEDCGRPGEVTSTISAKPKGKKP